MFTFSGLDPEYFFASGLANLGDVDGNDMPDLLLGVPLTSDELALGAVHVLLLGAGATVVGNVGIWGTEPNTYFGAAACGTGDMDGDGTRDAAVGAPRASPGGVRWSGMAVLNFLASNGSRRDFGLLSAYNGIAEERQLGSSIAVFGWGMRSVLVMGISKPNAPPALAFMRVAGCPTRDGMCILNRYSESYAPLPLPDGAAISVVCNVGDVNGDGAQDAGVGSKEGSGRFIVTLLSGVSGSWLSQSISSPSESGGANDNFGSSCAGAGDADGDGIVDVLVGAPGTSEGTGMVHLLFLSRTGGLRISAGFITGTSYYGTAVAVVGTQLVVGAGGDRFPNGFVAIGNVSCPLGSVEAWWAFEGVEGAEATHYGRVPHALTYATHLHLPLRTERFSF